jgi:hypothetical protein
VNTACFVSSGVALMVIVGGWGALYSFRLSTLRIIDMDDMVNPEHPLPSTVVACVRTEWLTNAREHHGHLVVVITNTVASLRICVPH